MNHALTTFRPGRARLTRAVAPLIALLLDACAGLPPAETPIEQAQRRMPHEAPLMVVDSCVYRRNLASFNHYIIEDSRQLANEGAPELMATFKDFGVTIRQYVVPVMCATNMPPRASDADGRVALNQDQEDRAESRRFPLALNDTVGQDAVLLAAYARLFEPCDFKAVRAERRYDCPLLSTEQAALLKARLKTPYLVAFSVGGDRSSPAHRSGMVAFGLLLGLINIPSDEGTARVRVVNLETGNLIYSSFRGEFTGQSPADVYYDAEYGGGRSRYTDLKINAGWAKRMVKPLFAPQR